MEKVSIKRFMTASRVRCVGGHIVKEAEKFGSGGGASVEGGVPGEDMVRKRGI